MSQYQVNEPIPRQGIFWSSVGGKPYPVSFRALSFERLYPVLDPEYRNPAGATFAKVLRNKIVRPEIQATTLAVDSVVVPRTEDREDQISSVDVLANMERQAIDALRNDLQLMARIATTTGVAWGSVKAFFINQLPATLDERDQRAYLLVPKAMTEIFGARNIGWQSIRNQQGITYVRKIV